MWILTSVALSTLVATSSVHSWSNQKTTISPQQYRQILKERLIATLSETCKQETGGDVKLEYNALIRKIETCWVQWHRPLTTQSLHVENCGTVPWTSTYICELQSITKNAFNACLIAKIESGELLQIISRNCRKVYEEIIQEIWRKQ